MMGFLALPELGRRLHLCSLCEDRGESLGLVR